MKENLVMLSDSYKYSHFNQYPKDTETVFSYLEARSDKTYPSTCFFGLQYLLKQYLANPISESDVLDAQRYAEFHGEPFNNEGWAYILKEKNGFLPLKISSVKEGTIVPNRNVLMTIENTDPKCFWLTNWAETLLMKVWYTTTIATKAYHCRKAMEYYWEKSSDNPDGILFAYHNFGDRGSSSVEAASIGGVAHLTQFNGTDNFNAVRYSELFYNEKFGFSIPASEHSTVTSWGKDKEYEMIANYLESFKDSPIIACVLDSFDIFKAVNFVTTGDMKTKIESKDYPVFVIRPDSGNPLQIMDRIINIMEENGVGYTVNKKGYKLFNKYRIIWGDGITPVKIDLILNHFTKLGYSAENFAFGSGGDLMQNLNRDTLGFAIKCSAIKRDGEWQDVYKDPVTDPGKSSKKGLVTLVSDKDHNFSTIKQSDFSAGTQITQLWTQYIDGNVISNESLSSVRKRCK